MRRRLVCALLAAVMSLLTAAAGAQAIVVNDNGTTAGVAVVPGSGADLSKAGVSPVSSSVSTCDPWLTSDLSLLPSIGLCSHGGPVMHANETFALTWDPGRSYWAGTKDYVEQFLKDVADGSGSFTSPYAVTAQYRDSGGDAANASKYGGACVDYGQGGYTCQFGSATSTGSGANYPASGCPVASGNTSCLTDAQIRSELTTHLKRSALLSHVMTGYTPLIVMLIPRGVGVCLDSAGSLCSVNGSSAAQFCSYHSVLDYNGQDVAYVVQPWSIYTACDEPKLDSLGANPTAQQIALDAGIRLVSPLSAAQIGAIVNPELNGWYAADGSEITDNGGCVPEGKPADQVTVGRSSQNPYYLQPEFNNGGVIDTDPEVPQCAIGVTLTPRFVVPSTLEPGDVMQLDGSVSVSTLVVPARDYVWNYGDGTTGTGPSVEHAYAKGGTYTVRLTITDRGGTTATASQAVTVLGANGQSPTQTTHPTTSTRLHVAIQLLPQSLRTMLRRGLAARVTSNELANGFVTLTIPHGAARQAHISSGRASSVVIGRGTLSGLKVGPQTLHLRLKGSTAAKLRRLRHVSLTIRLSLYAPGGGHTTILAAGRY
jgi:hypothetical protein